MFLKDIVAPRTSSGTFGSLLLDASTARQHDNTQDLSATTIGEESYAASDNSRQSSSTVEIDIPNTSTPVANDISAAGFSDQPNQDQPRKRQRQRDDQYKEFLEIEKKKLEYFEKRASKEPDSDDDDLLFWKSLMPYVKKIPTGMKLHFRSRIQDVVSEFAFANNMRPSQGSSSAPCHDTIIRYPESHQSSRESTPSYYTGTRASSASPHMYQYDSEAAQPSYTHFQGESFQ